jgi:hypothetical protein
MKKADCLSYGLAVLLTVVFFGIFFNGSDSSALLSNLVACQDYQCTTTEAKYGEVHSYAGACMELCPDYPAYPNVLSGLLFGYWIECYLYPTPGSKNLLGTANTTYGWGGCSVEKRGRSFTARLTYIQEGQGFVDTMKCVPCDNCCGIFY